MEEIGGISGLGPERLTENDLINDEADFFTAPIIDDTAELARECIYSPMQSLNQQGQLTFVIPGEAGYYIDPNTIRLVGKFCVKTINNENALVALTEDNTVSIANLIGSSLFNSITCTMNGINVSFVETANTHYKAYLQNVATYCSDAANTHMIASGFLMDTAGSFDTHNAASSGNLTRAGWINKSKSVGFSSWVHCDLLETNHLLLDNMGMTLNFHRTKDDWVLLSASTNKGKFALQLEKLELRLNKVELQPKVRNSIESRLALGQRARYPIIRSQIKIYNVPAQNAAFNWSNAIFGQLPFMVTVGMVEQAAYSGSIEKNGFNFQNFGVTDFWYTKNNYSMPAAHYRPTWDDRGYLIEYRMMNDYFHGGRHNAGDRITPELFKNGVTLFPMDFTPDRCAGYHRHSMGSGTISVNATFKKALDKAVTVILYAAYYDEYQIDANRIVYAVTDDKATPIG